MFMKVEMIDIQKCASPFLFCDFDFFANLLGQFGRFANLALFMRKDLFPKKFPKMIVITWDDCTNIFDVPSIHFNEPIHFDVPTIYFNVPIHLHVLPIYFNVPIHLDVPLQFQKIEVPIHFDVHLHLPPIKFDVPIHFEEESEVGSYRTVKTNFSLTFG